ncbi:MAG: holo-[acyl-carrier-protein] synthase [Dehalococcoidia bacterium]|nr:MAG: holo-[acyl-carrier-protein] synthase [Dehalococcoidia bacterium]
MVTTGVDVIAIERIATTVARHGDRFLRRVFTPAELAAAGGRPDSLAARFAAKEATAKALGWGIGAVGWRDIEVVSDVRGKPSLRLHGAAASRAAELGVSQLAVSLAHERSLAVAVVVGT